MIILEDSILDASIASATPEHVKSLLVIILAIFLSGAGIHAQNADSSGRLAVAARVAQTYGLQLDPLKFTLTELLDVESRICAARRIKRDHGIKFDYRQYSLGVLLDAESRIRTNRRLRQNYGLSYDYREHSFSELLDIENRVSTAQRLLREYGLNLDWRKHSVTQLRDAETAQRYARRHTRVPNEVISMRPGVAQSEVSGNTFSARAGNSSRSTYVPSRGYTSSSSRYYDYTYRPPVGDHYVAPYVRSDGTYVDGHHRTNRDDSFWNNYSSSGNVNPYTGRVGTKMPSTSSYRGGSTFVGGYHKRSGTYVSPHFRRSR